ncbi:hypothetical protein Tco_1361258 [Tanacetum coccineum]
MELNSPEFDQFFDIEEHFEEETTESMTEIMEQYMNKTRGDYGSGITRPKINQDAHFELKGQFLKELHDNTFSGSEHEDANKHIEKVLEIEVILFYNGLDVPTRQILDSKGVIPTKTAADAKIAIQEMAEFSQKWYNGTSSKTRSTKISNRIAAIQAQLNNIGREIKKVNGKCTMLGSDANYARDHIIQKIVHSRKRGKLSKRLTTHNLVHPINPKVSTKQQGQDSTNRTTETLHPSFYRCNNKKSRSFDQDLGNTDRTDEQSPARKMIRKSAQLHRNKPEGSEAQEVKILEANDHTLPQKGKDLGSFTLPCFIHNVCFDKALVNLGASFTIIDDEDVTRDVLLGIPFCKKFVSCQMIMKKFAHGDEWERINE